MGIAQLQGQQSQELLAQQTEANRPDTTTPFGSTNWTKGPNGQWSGSETLNPYLQGTLTEQEQQQQVQAGTGANMFNADMNAGTFNPVDYSKGPQVQAGQYYNDQATKASWDQFQNLEEPLMKQQSEQQDAQLVAQGLRPGDAAYDTAEGNIQRSQGVQTQEAADQAVLAGEQEAQTQQGMDVQAQQAYENMVSGNQNQNINAYNSVMGFNPNLGTSQIGTAQAGLAPTPNLLGAAEQEYGANLNTTNASNAGNANLWQGLGSAAMMAAMYASDARLKTDIERVGTAPSGVGIYKYKWKDTGAEEIGLVAQDVERIRPHAVRAIAGVKHVDYRAALA